MRKKLIVRKVYNIFHQPVGRILVEGPMNCYLPMHTRHTKHRLVRNVVENTTSLAICAASKLKIKLYVSFSCV